MHKFWKVRVSKSLSLSLQLCSVLQLFSAVKKVLIEYQGNGSSRYDGKESCVGYPLPTVPSSLSSRCDLVGSSSCRIRSIPESFHTSVHASRSRHLIGRLTHVTASPGQLRAARKPACAAAQRQQHTVQRQMQIARSAQRQQGAAGRGPIARSAQPDAQLIAPRNLATSQLGARLDTCVPTFSSPFLSSICLSLS